MSGFPEQVGRAPSHNDPERVIPTIEAELRPLARELLIAGFAVVDAVGPVQMACASLVLERDGTQVLFDAERGMSEVILIRGERRVWLGTAVAAWARSSTADGRVNAASLLPWSLISHVTWDTRTYRSKGLTQQSMYGMAVCEWFSHADSGAIDAVEAETSVLDTLSRSLASQTTEAAAEIVAVRYADALDRYFASQNAG